MNQTPLTVSLHAGPLIAVMLFGGACAGQVVEEVSLTDDEFEAAVINAEANGETTIIAEEHTDWISQSSDGQLEKVSSINVVLELEPNVMARRMVTCTVSCPGTGCVPKGCDAILLGCTSASRCKSNGSQCGVPTCSKTTTAEN